MRSTPILRASLLVCGLAAVGCGGTTTEPATSDTMPADPTPINELRSRFEMAYNASDAAGLAALYAEDAILLPDHAPAISGRAPIQQYYEQTFAQYTPNLRITVGETEIAGDVAHEHGTFSLNLTPKAEGGTAMTEEGKYLVIVERQADGTWLLHHNIGNSNSEHAAMPAQPGQP